MMAAMNQSGIASASAFPSMDADKVFCFSGLFFWGWSLLVLMLFVQVLLGLAVLLLEQPVAAFQGVVPQPRAVPFRQLCGGLCRAPAPYTSSTSRQPAAAGCRGRQAQARSQALLQATAGDGRGGTQEAKVNEAEKQQIQDLREALNQDTDFSPTEASQDMTFEEWKTAFGDVIESSVLRNVFDELDVDKNGKVSMREFINGIDGFHGGTVHPLAVKGVLQSVRLKMLDRISVLIRERRAKRKQLERREKIGRGLIAPVQAYGAYVRYKWNDKEESRKYRRTVFSGEDWRRFRSSGTSIFHNLDTMFNSRIIQGLWMEVGTVFLVALGVYVINASILSGLLQASIAWLLSVLSALPIFASWPCCLSATPIPTDGSFLMALPALPFQVSHLTRHNFGFRVKGLGFRSRDPPQSQFPRSSLAR